MKVYLPSWNGDYRLESYDGKSILKLHDPTPHERNIVGLFLHEAGKKKWREEHPKSSYDGDAKETIRLDAPLAKTSKLLIKLARPLKQTLTAVSFSNGELAVVDGTSDEAMRKIEAAVGKATASETKEKPATAASVKRPTPCCPDCEPGAIAPASEVLLSFLDEEQHESWRKQRTIVVTGGMTGNRYMIAHRHSPLGQKVGRITYDLDDDCIVHFHDRSVPPEEEVLAAKLILEHREPWLRNEATMFDAGSTKGEIFKNPFGDILDGTESASFTAAFAPFVQ